MKTETKLECIYPETPWEIIETEFNINHNYRNETIFALGNGYLGSRGTFEEAYNFDIKTGLEGNFINGFYESENIRYGELSYGYPEKSQTMLNVPNAKKIKLYLDGEGFDMRQGIIHSYERKLDLKNGLLTRNIIWESPGKQRVNIEIKRFASFKRRNLLVIEYRVTPINFCGELCFVSEIDAKVMNHTRETNSLIDYGPYDQVLITEKIHSDHNCTGILQRVKNNGFYLYCGAILSIKKFSLKDPQIIFTPDTSSMIEEECPRTETMFHINEGESAVLEKIIGYWTSLDIPQRHLENTGNKELWSALEAGYKELEHEQRIYMASFWDKADVVIDGNASMQQGIRFNLFHILQGAPLNDRVSIPAKCLTGEGYEGHYFWDTEMYLINPFICSIPEIARNILNYRYRCLNPARIRARIMGHKTGALFPWRTINGSEASAYYPQGTAQYHINADIAYALHYYLEMSGDTEYLLEKGAELLVETARLWYDLGSFTDTRDNKFCICDVTGPDEYTSIVDNNFYTNSMAAENMRNAHRVLEKIEREYPAAYKKLKNKINIKDGESETWLLAAKEMYYPYNEKLRIYGQDDTFLYKKQLEKNTIPEDMLPMLLHFHPLTVYRYRIAKQADLLFAMLLLGNNYSVEQKRRHFDYYEKVTLHDSSLSPCIFSILACDIGYYDKALAYFNMTSRLDLDDYHKNVYSGVHAANMAGTWMSITQGFAGMRVYDGILSFRPWIPEEWKSYSFKILFCGRRIGITVSHEGAVFALLEGEPLTIYSDSKPVHLKKD